MITGFFASLITALLGLWIWYAVTGAIDRARASGFDAGHTSAWKEAKVCLDSKERLIAATQEVAARAARRHDNELARSYGDFELLVFKAIKKRPDEWHAFIDHLHKNPPKETDLKDRLQRLLRGIDKEISCPRLSKE